MWQAGLLVVAPGHARHNSAPRPTGLYPAPSTRTCLHPSRAAAAPPPLPKPLTVSPATAAMAVLMRFAWAHIRLRRVMGLRSVREQSEALDLAVARQEEDDHWLPRQPANLWRLLARVLRVPWRRTWLNDH
jgi:hypothetical protein